MANLNGIPVYKIKIDESLSDNTGIDFISLVDFPAIETNWVALSKTDKKIPVQFAFNQDKKLLYGPALIPDMPIYRYSAQQGEYYVVFPQSEVQKLVRKFQKQNKSLNLNYQHQPDSQIDAVVQEIWLTGKNDKSQDFGFNLPEGSAFVVTYIEDDKFWNEQVKSGNVKGYSIEGFLDMELKKINMSEVKFIEAKTNVEGLTLKTDSEAWTVGANAVVMNAEGQESPAEGDYVLDNGTTIKCMAGKVTEIVEASEEELSPEEAAAMTKMFSKVLKPLQDKITELETKLANTPGAPSVTSKTDKPATKLTPAQAAFEKIKRIKELNKK